MSRIRSSSSDEEPAVLLKHVYERSVYIRVANLTRKEELGQKYKKGYEVHLVAKTRGELANVRRLLRQLGFKVGKPFQKHRRIVQPIYGKSAVKWFSSSTADEAKN